MTTAVTLTWSEFVAAAHVGLMRLGDVLARNRADDLRRAVPASWINQVDRHLLGASGELAVARATDRFWSPTVNTFHGSADVGPVEVRTRRDPAHDLIIRDSDKLERPFALVVGEPPAMQVIGWIRGSDVLGHPEWRRDYGQHGAAWFVPQAALAPLPERSS